MVLSYTPAIPTRLKLKQEDGEFKVSLDHIDLFPINIQNQLKYISNDN